MTSPKICSILSKTFVAPLLLCAASLFAQTPSFISFDAPGAGTSTGEGTEAIAINSQGLIAGYYIDNGDSSHGFVRSTSGVITEFTPSGFSNPIVTGVNSRGAVVGYGFASGAYTGFVRSINGNVLRFSVSGSTSFQTSGINDNNQVSGFYVDAAGVFHGFLRASNGVLTTIDDPNANMSGAKGTHALAISNNGTITGYYDDVNTGTSRAFVRDQFGNFTNYDPAAGGSDFVFPLAINLSGQVAGYYDSSNTQGFVRDASGTITSVNVVGAVSALPKAINDSGVITGFWLDPAFNTFGFVRDASGNITTFSLPVGNRGVLPEAINSSGRIAGTYFDKNNVLHGFVR